MATEDASSSHITRPDALVSRTRAYNSMELPRGTGVIATTIQVTDGWQVRGVVRAPQPTHVRDTSHVESSGTLSIDLEKNDRRDSHTITTFNLNLASMEELKSIQAAAPLPPKTSPKAWRLLRWNFFSVYRKAYALILTVNLIAIVLFTCQLRRAEGDGVATFANAATAASANFFLSIAFRNEHVVNGLFRLVCCLPVWLPLSVRRRAAKVYSYGGLHSGCGTSGALWYVVFAVLAMIQYPSGGPIETALAVTTGIILMILTIILFFSYPTMRSKLHDHFEATHRYGGWSAILILWVQTMLLVLVDAQAKQGSFGGSLVRSPPFWFLVGITAFLIYPWTRLRARKVRVERLSGHATRLHFDYRDIESCMAVRLTDAPLVETHAFATIPNYHASGKGFSILISNAGDWTNKIINDRPPEKIYVKGAPTLGVMRVALMFKKVLVVCTGSGIGPCLSLLQAYPDFPVRVLWSTQDPETTYGQGVVKAVLRSDPNAVIVDTKKHGRPDMLALAYGMLVAAECEAAIVISNPALTRKVVYGLEVRGVPAFGPIFDS